MAYIPPHKRHSKDTERWSPPKPQLLKPFFNKSNIDNLKFKSPRTKNLAPRDWNSKMIYAKNAKSKWFAVGFDDDDHHEFPASVSLRPVSFEAVELQVGEKPLALIYDDQSEVEKMRETGLNSPWEFIAENVMEDLLSSFEHVRSEMESKGHEEVRPTLVARFGKIIFRRCSLGQFITEDLACGEDTLRQCRRSFNTSIPKSYMDYILEEGAQKIGVEFEDEKDVYHVKLSDSTRCDATISCKCRVLKEDGKLELYKIDLNQVRHMVMDISCLEKNVDLRLMLCTKRNFTPLTDDDMQSIRDLIACAVVDSGVKGGLRWPLGKSPSRNKFSVVASWHTTTKSYVNASMRLKVRNADRFNFTNSTGEASKEIIIKLKGVASELKDQQVDENAIKEMLKDDLRVLWESFFCCESFLKW